METLAAIIIGPIVLMTVVGVLYCAGAMLIELFSQPKYIIESAIDRKKKK